MWDWACELDTIRHTKTHPLKSFPKIGKGVMGPVAYVEFLLQHV
jgi:hypothetical protein